MIVSLISFIRTSGPFSHSSSSFVLSGDAAMSEEEEKRRKRKMSNYFSADAASASASASAAAGRRRYDDFHTTTMEPLMDQLSVSAIQIVYVLYLCGCMQYYYPITISLIKKVTY
jgi:hypothetical protein